MIEFFQEIAIIKCPEVLDFKIIENLENEVNYLVEEGNASFVLDLTQCVFIDSASLSFIVRQYKKCCELDGSLKICCIKHPKVRQVFQLTKLDKVINIYEDLTEALKNL